MLATVVHISPSSFLEIIAAAAVAATIAALATSRGLAIPVVVLELFFGVLIGPEVLGVQVTSFIAFFADLGLGMLFFFAGYELDLARLRGHPLRLALAGWVVSLALAYSIGGALAAAGIVLSLLYTGSALATTALGTLIPIISDAGELRTRFGRHVLACGAVGELGPILLVTLVLSAQSTAHNALILLAFVGLAVVVAVFALRSSRRALPLFEQTLERSPQLIVRWTLVLVFALALLAFELGLDLLLGAFAAGLITRGALHDGEVPAFDSKLTAVAFGVFVPFFFIVSGMRIDVAALVSSGSGALKLLLFLALFLVVRGGPVQLLYRRTLGSRDRTALALMASTQLPLVIAITTLATSEGHMRASTAAALVGAAALSTLLFPAIALRVRGDVIRAEPTADVLLGP